MSERTATLTAAGISAVLMVILVFLQIQQSNTLSQETEDAARWRAEVSERLSELELEVKRSRVKVEQMEEDSVGGIMRNANNAVAQGWMSMLDSMGREMDRASELFARELEKLNEDEP